MLACQEDGRPAHLTRVHEALVSLPGPDRLRLGITLDGLGREHLLSYRQTEYTFNLVLRALEKEQPDGAPSVELSFVIDQLLESSVPAEFKETTTALAVDWSDLESFSCPPAEKDGPCADPEASWGRRKSGVPGQKDELFFGYELQSATMVGEEGGPSVPELSRRILVTSCSIDPPAAFVAVLRAMAEAGIALGDVLADSGYAHRRAEHWAVPLRQMGARLVMDLHPQDRGPQGTHAGAIVSNGRLYCPSTPRALLELGPLGRSATEAEITAHDRKTAELSRYKLGRITSDDADGFHRVMCPAVMGKLRCPLRPASMTLSHERAEVLAPPEHGPACCCQKSVTVGAEVAAKTAQKHDYPSRAHRYSYARRTAVERTFSTTKDRASNDMTRGWCRLMGTGAVFLFAGCLFVVRNARILDAFEKKRDDDARRLADGLPRRTRRRRRKTLGDITSAS